MASVMRRTTSVSTMISWRTLFSRTSYRMSTAFRMRTL